jgi:hypothetical protein
MAQSVEAREAEQGERMIEVKVRFWTNDLTDNGTKGKIRPKHAWGAGIVRIKRNASHGIVLGKPVPFNSLLELPGAIEKVLIEHGVKIHRSRKMKRYAPTPERIAR